MQFYRALYTPLSNGSTQSECADEPGVGQPNIASLASAPVEPISRSLHTSQIPKRREIRAPGNDAILALKQ